MAVEQAPRIRCDRPGCHAVVTDKGGRFALCEGDEPREVYPMNPDGQPQTPVNSDDPLVRVCSVDLCRSCAESLRTWWTSKERNAGRAATVEER